MTGVIDRAQGREQEFLDDALTEQNRRAGLTGKTVDDSALECRHCKMPIPELRRQGYPGVQTCVKCQSDIERQGFVDWGMAE